MRAEHLLALRLVTMCLACAAASDTLAQTPTSPPARASKSVKPAASPAAFDDLIKRAEAARKSAQWEESIALYARTVKLRPDYVEGYWYQGTAYYSLDRFAECREAFRRVVRMAPKNGAAYAFLGLCEFGLKDYDRALTHIMQSRVLGVADKDLGSAARYHAGIMLSRIEQYEQALERLGEFASEGNDNPRVIEAMGIATLRMPMLPIEVPPDRREMVMMAGRASYLMATRMTAAAGTAFATLVARYPDTANVHYAYAVYLLIEQPDKAIDEFKRELEIQPGHPDAITHIAYEYLRRRDGAAALPWAKQAVETAPKMFSAHKAVGEALMLTGDIDAAITHLETSAKLAPDSPTTHLSLSKAYQRAGRTADAAREREEFARLDRLARTDRSGAQSVGGIDTDPQATSPQ